MKAPTLVCDDGTVLHDSNLILRYIERSLTGPLTNEVALADGCIGG